MRYRGVAAWGRKGEFDTAEELIEWARELGPTEVLLFVPEEDRARIESALT